MKRAKSISVEKLQEVAEYAAKVILDDRFAGIERGKIDIGWFPDIGLIGIVLPDLRLETVQLSEMLDASTKIAERAGALSRGLEPSVMFGRDWGTMGYFPPEPVVLRRV